VALKRNVVQMFICALLCGTVVCFGTRLDTHWHQSAGNSSINMMSYFYGKAYSDNKNHCHIL